MEVLYIAQLFEEGMAPSGYSPVKLMKSSAFRRFSNQNAGALTGPGSTQLITLNTKPSSLK
jgi:hypothetical protein